MTPEILQGLLWRLRSGLRADSINLSAGHGIADPNYRPPRLPYASILGPLNIQTESERDLPEVAYLWARSPGYVSAQARRQADLIPAGGSLHLRFDAEAIVHLSIDFAALGNQPFNDTNGPAVATTIETTLHSAIDAGEVELETGTVEPGRQVELRASTVRWDRAQARLVISSGRRGTLDDLDERVEQISRVEVLDGADNLAEVLGLGEGAVQADGRIVRHRVPNPIALGVDVRLDLWAGTQRELALMMDSWCRMTPTRGQLLVRPGLLSEDVAHGATVLKLQRRGESPHPSTLLQLEAEREFVDRLSALAPSLQDGATLDESGLHLGGIANATVPVYEAPAVPTPWRDENPGPYGFAATLGLALEAEPSAGDGAEVLRLQHADRNVLQLQLEIPAVVNGEDPQVDLIALAQHSDGTPFSESRARVPLERLRTPDGIQVHLLVSAVGGRTQLLIDGIPGVAAAGFVPPAPAPGATSGGSDMRLLLGDPDGIDVALRIGHLQLYARPLGPSDPQQRNSLSLASTWRPGEPLALARSSNGYSGDGKAFTAVVVAIDGDTVQLDRAVQGDWPLSQTLVYQRGLFFSQKQFRRRDDFMNQLYRVTVEYRVSAYLQEHRPAISAPLVEDYDVNIRVLDRMRAEEANPDAPNYPSRPAAGRLGVRTRIQSAHGNHS